MSHYFGSTVFNWAVAPTRTELLAKLAKDVGADVIKRNVKNLGGLYVWTCKVPLPIEAEYQIKNFAPAVEGVCDTQEYLIQNVKGFVLPLEK